MVSINPNPLRQTPPPVIASADMGDDDMGNMDKNKDKNKPTAKDATTLNSPTLTGTPQEALQQVLQMIMMVIMALIQGDATGQSLPQIGAPQPVTGIGGSVTPPPAAGGTNGQPVIVQLDDFVTDAGETNEQILSSQGAKVVPINVNKDQTQNRSTSVSQGLDQVLQMVKSGQQVDVVNLQQQDFAPSAASEHIRSVVDQLSALGIPVVISAGLSQQQNVNGIHNQFGTANSFNVQAVDNLGDFTAVPGNVSHAGTHAPARLSVEIAAMKAKGATLEEIRQALGIN